MVKKFQLWKVKIFLIILLTFTYSNIILWGAPASQSLQLRYGGKDITYTSPPTTLKIDGQTIIPGAMPPVIIDGRTLVPVREVFEQLGASVGWDDHTQEITIIWEDKFIVLQVDNPMAMVNDNVQTMDVPPKLITNKELNITKTMVPFRFITETFGFENIWDPENYIVNAISPQVTIPKPEEQDPEIPNPEVIDPKEENLEDKEPNQQGEFDIVIPDQAIIPPSPPVIREEHPTTAITKVEVPQKIQGNAEIKIHGT
ncbi:MAG: copper amine oxidase N-terminal domain-containing protein, partial [Epulopiscium sp.]|nr:copper amine oxidase N-terminal domain-containing protein [Candidatus Epulonipiscium sp.]